MSSSRCGVETRLCACNSRSLEGRGRCPFPRARINLNSHYYREAGRDTPLDPTPNTGNSGLLGRTALGCGFISPEPLSIVRQRASPRLAHSSIVHRFGFSPRGPVAPVYFINSTVLVRSVAARCAPPTGKVPLKPRQIGFRDGTPVGRVLRPRYHRVLPYFRSGSAIYFRH